MPPRRFAVLTIDYELTATGFIITITTNAPSHLYMRWTTKEPGIHHVPVFSRGVAIRSDIKVCFVVWEDNEQEEAGDTLIHTFIKEPWAHCETRWFYFHGTVFGGVSPSTSPILEKHRIAPGVPKYFTALATADDFTVRCPLTVNYITAHSANGGWFSDTYNDCIVHAARYSSDRWYIGRAALVFDTLTLDPTWNIIKARLHFWCTYKATGDPSPLSFLNANTITIPGGLSSYPQLRNITDIVAQIPFADIVLAAWNYVDIDPSKLNVIRPGQLTIIGLRRLLDINIDDGGQLQDVVWGSYVSAYDRPDYEPYLEIEAL